MITLLKACFLAVSIYGYLQFFSKKIKAEFALAFTFASIACIMFFAGILNILLPAAYAIAIAGILLAAVSLKDFKFSIQRIITPGTVFFAILCVVYLFALKGAIMSSHDDFTHWGTVLQVFFNHNRFPTPADSYITFQSYPPGTASFIYFFCKIWGNQSEWVQLYAQAVLQSSFIVALFSFIKFEKSFSFIAKFISASIISCAILCCNTVSSSLCVDSMLSIVAIGGMALCIYYKDNLSEKLWYTIPFTVFLMTVKNSGLLFSAVIILYVIIYLPKTLSSLFNWFLISIAPFLSFFIWQKHVDRVFEDGLDSLHAMSKDHYATLYEEKVAENIVGDICNMFAQEVFSPHNIALYIFILIFIVILLCKLIGNIPLKHTLVPGIFLFLVYVAYQAGTLCMYLFSMPSYEVMALPSYHRYHLTVLAFVAGVFACIVLSVLDREATDKKGLFSALTALLIYCSLCNMLLSPDYSSFKKQDPAIVSKRTELINILQEYNVPQGKSYIVIENPYETDIESLFVYTKYSLLSEDYIVWKPDTLKKYSQYLNNYEYLILYDNSSETIEIVSKLLNTEISERVIHLPSYIDQVYVYD